MQSLFLEGLKVARDLAKDGDLSVLDALIQEHETGIIETAAINPAIESRGIGRGFLTQGDHQQ